MWLPPAEKSPLMSGEGKVCPQPVGESRGLYSRDNRRLKCLKEFREEEVSREEAFCGICCRGAIHTQDISTANIGRLFGRQAVGICAGEAMRVEPIGS